MALSRLVRQTLALIKKNLTIIILRHRFSTIFRAFLLPVIYVSFLSYSQNLLTTPAKYGIGSPSTIDSLQDRLADSNRKLVFINKGSGNDIDDVITAVSGPLRSVGNVVVLQNDQIDLQRACKQTLQGSSSCFAAVVFEDSPESSDDGRWNYTLRGDLSFSFGRINVDKHSNAVEKYLLPVQMAVSEAIARQTNGSAPERVIEEYAFTDLSQEEHEAKIRRDYQSTIINFIAVAIFIGMVGIIYQQTGFQAMERERGLATLVEAMGGLKSARLASFNVAFSLTYLSGWIVMAGTLQGGLFKESSIGVTIIWHILSGFSLAAWSSFLGAFFKRAQLSGITATIISLGVAIVAQVCKASSAGGVAILSLLFPPANYVFFCIGLARFEQKELGASLVKAPPGPSSLPLIALWVFSAVQIPVFLALAGLVERFLYGTASPKHRHIDPAGMHEDNAVEIRNFTKHYKPSFFSKMFDKNADQVVAVDSLNLNLHRGQILVLLGANGSGKTTTLEAVFGVAPVTEGDILISTEGTGTGLGICPQQNVLWDDLSVEEHVRLWNKIKCNGDDKGTLRQLIEECDLKAKRRALSKTLSGGQKRKLQLAVMLTGGSKVCAIDEVSSGLDPLSRRKIWDIILGARGDRTILMTTHFLDEADLLADQIAVLSKGHLKTAGSAVELKTQLGGGYRVHTAGQGPELPGVPMSFLHDETVYNVPDGASANRVITQLEEQNVTDYNINGPTIEDVFLRLAEEAKSEAEPVQKTESLENMMSDEVKSEGVNLYPGRRVSIFKQAMILIQKRLVILKRNYLPSCAAIIIPIIASGITMVTMKDFNGVSCDPSQSVEDIDSESFTLDGSIDIVLGPRDQITTTERLSDLTDILLPNTTGLPGVDVNFEGGLDAVLNNITFVDSVSQMQDYIKENYHNVTPGGLFLTDNGATYAWLGGNGDMFALQLQNLADNLIYDVPNGIISQYQPFDYTWPAGTGNSLLFILYTGLAFAAYPAFFALYPTVERLRKVRALHFSNGVRSAALWTAYTLYDFVDVLTVTVISTIILAAATSGWFNIGYLFVVMLLYGIAATVLSYCISLFARSQLSAFAFAAGYQAVMFFLYFLIFMSIYTYADPSNVTDVINSAHFVIAIFAPIVSLVRSFFVVVNLFQFDCRGETLATYPGEMTLYGGPILYLIVQSIVCFGFLLWYDSGRWRLHLPSFRRKKQEEETVIALDEKEITEELARVNSATAPKEGLRILHLSKKFGKSTAVDDVSFGVRPNEVFALLGPNGAGKTTTISMVRGDIPASEGEIFVEGINVKERRAAARSHLGVCPQFDAMDRMTVVEHLRFYAKIRGVEEVEHNVKEVIRAVGLRGYEKRLGEKLSGGNKRKLSLAIAMMGNPQVLLLDEPSSGMDAAAKRVMWSTLKSILPTRSLLLTTHSMEEADALSTRAGILSKRMLALGSTAALKRKYGDRFLLHIVLKSAPYSTETEMEGVKAWLRESFEDVQVEDRSFGGQIRASISAGASVRGSENEREESGTTGVRAVFALLEEEGAERGCAFWSVGSATLDQVFLRVVDRAGVGEEEGTSGKVRKRWIRILLTVLWPCKRW